MNVITNESYINLKRFDPYIGNYLAMGVKFTLNGKEEKYYFAGTSTNQDRKSVKYNWENIVKPQILSTGEYYCVYDWDFSKNYHKRS